ncbi:MAG: sigma 54-interacting transcriptional regulator [Planctomycetes bacterium]|nr:sigma 54-interacting transcriptional regulator [Planctomycetota bacterium]
MENKKFEDGLLRDSGLKLIGKAPWGTHFCQFYQTKQDLINILVPYFKAGLKNNEFCMWITSEPLGAAEAKSALAKEVKDLDDYIKKGHIEILDYRQWYTKSGRFNEDAVLAGWAAKEEKALKKGFAGLRLSGNTFWLEKKDWKAFTDYEEAVNNVIGQHRMMAICTYSLDRCNALEIIDVISNHQFALINRSGKWEVIESSDYRQAKEALKESEAKYRSIIETANEGIWIADAQTRTIYINRKMSNMLGYSPEEMIGKSYFNFMAKEGKAMARGKMKQRRRGVREIYENKYLHKDGSPRWMLISVSPVTDDKGNFAGSMAMFTDITERKKTEKELAYLSKFPSENPNPIMRIAPNGILLYCNKAGASLTKHWKWEMNKAISAEWRKLVADAFKSGARKDIEMEADRRFFVFTLAPIAAEDYVNVYGRDITERKQAEETLREREKWLSKTQEIAHLGTWELDLVNNRLYWSDEVYRIFGLKPQEFTATYEAFLERVHPDDRAAVNNAYTESLRQGKNAYEIEHRIVRKATGKIRIVHEKCEHIRDENNKVIYSIGMVHDITERRQADEAVKKSEQKLKAIFNSMPCVVMIMDEERRVMAINNASQQILGIPSDKIFNQRWGDALKCIHASETPQGCGFSASCSNCQVRNTALTALSGNSIQKVKADFEFLVNGEIQKRLLAINAAPIEYEQKKMAVIIVEDITELAYLRQRLKIEHSFAGIVGKDEKMLELYDSIRELADSSAPVLVQGESGTGKELVASAIHNEGPRRNKQFVPVNCGALPDGLLESELFGHCRGAFTGAIRDKKGRFELAHGGTIFLDEVGDLSPAMQVKLLRVLQDGSFEPVGSEKTMKVDVRIISATNKNLHKEIKAGRFREDLFYRLCVVPLTMPPLREKINDIPLLAKTFLEWSAKEYQKEKVSLSPEALDILMGYYWPGNVRELQNALQFAMVKCRGKVIKPENLPASISPFNKRPLLRRQRKGKLDSRSVEEALKKTAGNKLEAAKLLGVGRATIHRFLAEK